MLPTALAVVLFQLEPIFLSPFPLWHIGMWVCVQCCLYEDNRAMRTRSCSISEEEKLSGCPSSVITSIYSTATTPGEIKKLLSNCRRHRNWATTKIRGVQYRIRTAPSVCKFSGCSFFLQKVE